jgi:TPR repeat protein
MSKRPAPIGRRLGMAAAMILAVAAPSLPGAAGDCYEQGLAAYEAREYVQARAKLTPLAEQGDPRAQYLLGYMHEKGQGVDRNLEAAARWYRRAAEAGHPESQYRLAVGYLCGVGGLPKDEEKAAAWLKRSAQAGYPKAQKVLARMDSRGGVGLLRDARVALYCLVLR